MKPQPILRGNNKYRHALAAVFLTLFTLSAVFFTACDKELPLAERKTEDTKAPNTEAYKFSYQGKLYEAAEFQKLFKDKEFPLMVTGTDMPEKDVIYVFDSKADYQGWAQTTPLAGKLAQINEAVAKARNNSDPNSTSLSKGSGIGGWTTLYDGVYSNAIWNAYATNAIANMGPGDNRMTSLTIGNPSNLETVLSLHSLPGFQGCQFIIHIKPPILKASYNFLNNYWWDNTVSSFIVL